MNGTVQNPAFIQFLEKVGNETQQSFSTRDWLILDLLSREKNVPDSLKPRLHDLIEMGIAERIGKRRAILSRKYYRFVGKKGEYTRKSGLDKETNKALLEKHITDHKSEGSPMRDLLQVLPALTREQVKGLLKELRHEGRVYMKGAKRGSLWYPGSSVN
jgi:ATP-dependent DNA helicase RecG